MSPTQRDLQKTMVEVVAASYCLPPMSCQSRAAGQGEKGTIHLVSSLNRSGSSMLMDCLITGGMAARWDTRQDGANVRIGDGYVPNPNGFYAMPATEFQRPDFADEYDGYLLKCPYQLLVTLPRHQYKLAFISREPIEVQTSMHAFIPGQSWGRNESAVVLSAVVIPALFRRLADRGDMEVKSLSYSAVLTNSEKELDTLGWQIDVAKAAAVVNESLYRNRLEGSK